MPNEGSQAQSKVAKRRTYQPAKAELAAIRKGEAALARGEQVSLEEFLASLKSRSEPKITKAISQSAGRFQTGRYED